MTNQTTKIDPANRYGEADSDLDKAIRLLWCTIEYIKITFRRPGGADLKKNCNKFYRTSQHVVTLDGS